MVWNTIVVRSWNSKKAEPRMCDGRSCRTGTTTALIVYSNDSSSTGCMDGTRAADDPVGDFIDVIEVPLDDPSRAGLLRREPLAGALTDVRTGCHEGGVIQGKVNLAACASADATNVFDIGRNEHDQPPRRRRPSRNRNAAPCLRVGRRLRSRACARSRTSRAASTAVVRLRRTCAAGASATVGG